MNIKNWIQDRKYDFYFWWDNKPFKKIYNGVVDRFHAFIFCLLLLIVGVFSPKTLRKLMIDALDHK